VSTGAAAAGLMSSKRLSAGGGEVMVGQYSSKSGIGSGIRGGVRSAPSGCEGRVGGAGCCAVGKRLPEECGAAWGGVARVTVQVVAVVTRGTGAYEVVKVVGVEGMTEGRLYAPGWLRWAASWSLDRKSSAQHPQRIQNRQHLGSPCFR